jgi:alpha-tubulin suppressor-like RCC1 family protein
LMADGTVLAWGDNAVHQSANNAVTPQLTPVAVPGLANVRSISAGFSNSFALLNDGTVAFWGLDLGTPDEQSPLSTTDTPTIVPGLEQCVSVQGSGLNFATALTADGNVWTWGSNLFGELGDGKESDGTDALQQYDRALPGLVTLPVTGRSIASGASGSVVIGWDGSLWTWGGGFLDQDTGVLPFQVAGLTGAVAAVSAGSRQTFLAGDGGLWQWTKTTTDAATPLAVGNVVQIAVSPDHSVALDKAGKVWTWGTDDAGQLGDGPTVRTDLETPAALSTLDLDGP